MAAPKQGKISRYPRTVNVRKRKRQLPEGKKWARLAERERRAHPQETKDKNRWQRQYYKKNRGKILRYQKNYRKRKSVVGPTKQYITRRKTD